MSNDLTTTSRQLMTPASSQATLLEMRKDSTKYPRVGSVTRDAAIVEMTKIVSQAFLYKGQTADPTNIQFIACALVDELQSDLDHLGTKYISFAEISRIVKRSILQDEMYGISVASLYKVIIEYIKGEGHRLDKEVDRCYVSPSTEPMINAYAGMMKTNSKL